MTGFARAAGQDQRCAWTWEIKSVNGRGLDLRCRLAAGYDALEAEIRKRAASHFDRGNLSLSLHVSWTGGEATTRINRALLDQVLALSAGLVSERGLNPPSIDGLLALPGMLESVVEEESVVRARERLIIESLDQALERLAAARGEEGAALEKVIAGLLDRIAALTDSASASEAMQPAEIKRRLESQLAELLAGQPAIAPEVLAHEAALLATKADIREEIDRLTAHLAAARVLMGEGGAIGRRFDFLCQEFNREANTLCAKAASLDLTRAGIALKAAIDQLREQVQNLE